MVPLIAVAHGSRDPRSAATISAVVERIRASRPELDVRPAFLDLNAPSVDRVVDAVAAQGYSSAVVVPLLLGNAFHARIDLPGILAGARARHPRLTLVQADVLGNDPRLAAAVRRRAIEAGADPTDDRLGLVVAAVGSSSPAANARTRRIAASIAQGTAWHARPCFAAAAEPTAVETISALRHVGAERFLVAPWFLAPGLLTDRIARSVPDVPLAQPIGAHPLVADVVLDRFDDALTRSEFAGRLVLSA